MGGERSSQAAQNLLAMRGHLMRWDERIITQEDHVRSIIYTNRAAVDRCLRMAFWWTLALAVIGSLAVYLWIISLPVRWQSLGIAVQLLATLEALGTAFLWLYWYSTRQNAKVEAKLIKDGDIDGLEEHRFRQRVT